MSRSYYKSNVRKIAQSNPKSQRLWKSKANRKLRRIVKTNLNGDFELTDLNVRDVSDIWASPSDGYHWVDMKEIEKYFGDQKFKFYNK